MFRLIRLFRTSIGSKLMMALSGLLLILFIAGHMLGNMTLYQGPDALNGYAAWLQGHPLLWVFRLAMLLLFGVHVYTGLRLAQENRAARQPRYQRQPSLQVGLAGRTMALSGLVVLGFVIYHLLHLTLGVIDPRHWQLHDSLGRADVYARVVLGFQNPWMAGSYVLALLLLGLHLNHAIGSLFQTLGFNHESYDTLLKVGAALVSVLLVLGFASVPISIQLGLVTLPARGGP